MKNKLFLLLILLLFTGISQAQWQPDVRLTNNPAISRTSNTSAWCIASSGNFVHVVWYDNRDGNYEIYYKRSTNGGISWGADTRLTNNSFRSESPSVSVSGSTLHVVWYDLRDGNDQIYYKRSTDGGISWGADTRLTNNLAIAVLPSVSVSGSAVYIVWQDFRDGDGEIYYKSSSDGGISWIIDTRLTNDSASSEAPSVSVSGSVVHVAWFENRDGNYEIYYKRSTDGGISWNIDTRLTNDSAYSFFPSVSVSGSSVNVVWIENRDGNYEIYYSRSTDGGISWGANTRLTNSSADSESPSVSVSGSDVHVVWYDRRDGNYEIYYKHSTDGGTSWGADTRLTNNSATSSNASVSVSGTVIHVVWHDNRDGNNEIYYKRDTINGGGTLKRFIGTSYVEGFYNSSTNSTIADTLKVTVRSAISPYNMIASSIGKTNTSGYSIIALSPVVQNSVPYYIQMNHRNSIETWSKTTQVFTSDSLYYDFYPAATRAYGDNQKQIDASPVAFGFYSGDINQDENVDVTDIISVFNDANNFVSGYVNTDVTGDDFVDASDLIITYNNSINFVSVITP